MVTNFLPHFSNPYEGCTVTRVYRDDEGKYFELGAKYKLTYHNKTVGFFETETKAWEQARIISSKR